MTPTSRRSGPRRAASHVTCILCARSSYDMTTSQSVQMTRGGKWGLGLLGSAHGTVCGGSERCSRRRGCCDNCIVARSDLRCLHSPLALQQLFVTEEFTTLSQWQRLSREPRPSRWVIAAAAPHWLCVLRTLNCRRHARWFTHGRVVPRRIPPCIAAAASSSSLISEGAPPPPCM